jgi:hypothetical protein
VRILSLTHPNNNKFQDLRVLIIHFFNLSKNSVGILDFLTLIVVMCILSCMIIIINLLFFVKSCPKASLLQSFMSFQTVFVVRQFTDLRRRQPLCQNKPFSVNMCQNKPCYTRSMCLSLAHLLGLAHIEF